MKRFSLLLLLLLAAPGLTARADDNRLLLALMPKAKGNAYFLSCKAGADRAAVELGVELLFDGPVDTNAAKQNEIVENWITLGVDAIAVSAENKESLSTALRKARRAGITVVTFDSDVLPDARGSWFWGHATAAMRGVTCLTTRPDVDKDKLGIAREERAS
jgi:ABC-type sugar transport system substrate-binding protein